MKKNFWNYLPAVAALLVCWGSGLLSAQEEKIGVRPYEMDWAGRTEEVNPVLIDFEQFGGWKIETENSVADFKQSREEQLYGDYVGKLTYRKADAEGGNAPVVLVLLDEPIAVTDPFDTVSLWVRGNNWGWTTDPKTPQTRLSLLFQKGDGTEYTVFLYQINWNDWFLCYRHLNKDQIAALSGEGIRFLGFRLDGGTNTEDRSIYLDSLCLFTEEFKPLEFTKRPKRNLELFPGQNPGQNTGEGTLPFPTRPETIEPANLTADFSNRIEPFDEDGQACWRFVYEGADGKVTYTYRPGSGTWSDFTAQWNEENAFVPLSGGGITTLAEGKKTEGIKTFTPIEIKQDGSEVISRWHLAGETLEADVEYRFAIRGKNLILDTLCAGGKANKVSFGRVEKIGKNKNILIPYFSYGYTVRPAALLFQTPGSETSLFALGNIDWYRSNASYLLGKYGTGAGFGITNGEAQYNLKTDGARNDVFERFVFTVSPRFEEILPTIANPPSPWKSVTGSGVWQAHGATTRDADKKHFYDVWRHGMRHVIITDHEVCWRDEGESFTFRTRPAPKKGGDAGWIDYSQFMQKTLGFVYGPYNNFTDFAPVNEYWSPDMISRTSDNDLQGAWCRCYAPKPSRAVEYCEKLSPINQEKFHFSTAYCDVHSSVTPWSRTDYDWRVPGAGTFAATYYAYGEIFLLQKKAWNGPVYSEGPHHCFYSGLTDGNYAQDQAYQFMNRPWLVDFDLLKMHPLECDFGMGNPGMFAPNYFPSDAQSKDAFLDRFITATIAFGHPGFLPYNGGDTEQAQILGLKQGDSMSTVLRGYAMTQQIATRYTMADAASIRYADKDGTLYETSEALAKGVCDGNHLVVCYQDGTVVVANGNPKQMMTVEIDGRTITLPPNGYEAWTADGQIHTVSKYDETGSRYDYCDSPEYIYFDSRTSAKRVDKAMGFGQALCRKLEGGGFEVIPINGTRIGFAVDANRAVALDYDNNEIGEAALVCDRGFLFVEPVEGAFSYRLEKSGDSALSAAWKSDSIDAFPGETVMVTSTSDSSKTAEVTIPQDAKVGQFYETDLDGGKIGFIVRPLATADFRPVEGNRLKVDLTVGSDRIETVSLRFAHREQTAEQTVRVENKKASAIFDLMDPKEGEEPIRLTASAGGLSLEIQKTLKTAFVYPDLGFDFGDRSDSTVEPPEATAEIRKGQSRTVAADINETGASFVRMNGASCGGVTKGAGMFAHPPYRNGTGRVWLDYTVDIPADGALFTSEVGKRDGGDPGDGIWFSVLSVAEDGTETLLGDTSVPTYRWQQFDVDLTPCAGRTVTLRLCVDCGPANNTIADHAAWHGLKLLGKQRVFQYQVQ